MNYRITLCFILLIAAVSPALIGCAGETTAPNPGPRGPVWVVFNKESNGIVSDSVNAFAQDVDGGIWLGTDNGASKFLQGSWANYQKPLEFTIYTPLGSFISRKVNAITVGKDATVWFGTAGGGILRFNPNGAGSTWTQYIAPSLPSAFVLSLTTDNNGYIWVGTSEGACEFIPSQSNTTPLAGSWRELTRGSPIPAEPIYSVAFNPNDNTIWFGTFSQGIVWYDGDQVWNIDQPRDVPYPIYSLAFGASNVAWIGTFGDWAYKYTVGTGQWVHYTDTTSAGTLPSSMVYAIASDYHGVTWFGTALGLTKFDGKQWSTFTHANSQLPGDVVRALTVDSKGNLWIGTTNGVAVYNVAGTKL